MTTNDQTVGVTGAGGFVGGHLVGELTARGYEVIGLDCDPDAEETVRRAGAEPVIGDVRDRKTVEAVCRRCDSVVHTAALVGEGGAIERYRAVNVRGTRSLAQAAASSGVDRLLHLSSVMVYGFEYPREVDESGPLRGEDNPYCTTKIESERVVQSVEATSDLEVVIARPGDVWGPGSDPWVVRPLEWMRRHLFVLPDGGRGRLDPIYVDNLVDALIALLDRGQSGEAYNVTDGRSMQTREYFGRLAEWLGREKVPTCPGNWLEVAFGTVETGFDALGLEPPARRAALNFLTRPHPYSNEKLTRNIGYTPEVTFEEGLERTERWARDRGLV
ncbi:MAG: NAD-dependent epimerase/dehydratase family protein [Bradymonadaceae bacterium]